MGVAGADQHPVTAVVYDSSGKRLDLCDQLCTSLTGSCKATFPPGASTSSTEPEDASSCYCRSFSEESDADGGVGEPDQAHAAAADPVAAKAWPHSGSDQAASGSSDDEEDDQTQPLTLVEQRNSSGGSAAAIAGGGSFVPGQRYYMDLPFTTPWLKWLEDRVVEATLFMYMSLPYELGIVTLLGLFGFRFFFWLATVVWLTYLIPCEPFMWEPMANMYILRAWRRYFSFSLAFEAPLEGGQKYVMAAYPHGVFPLSQMLATTVRGVWPKGMRIYSVAASAVFLVPIWRHYMAWLGFKPATADNFKSLLADGSVTLVPGGIAEMYLTSSEKEMIKIQDRKGFIRLAVAAGAPLLPMYHFGNSCLMQWGGRSLEKLARRWRVSIGHMNGRYGFPLPYRLPLFMAVGKPIHVPHLSPEDPGFNEAVDKAHAQLIKAIEHLYNKYKGQYGWEDRPLVMQ